MTDKKTASQTLPASQRLAKTEDKPLAVQPIGFGSMANAEQEDFSIDRMCLIQGTATEVEMYGEHKRGTWVLSSTGAEMEVENRMFIPISGWNEWIKYTDGGIGSGIDYRTMDKASIPPEDLEWGSGRNGVGTAAIKHNNWLVLFDGDECPVLLSFKKTSLKSGQAIMKLEAQRRASASRRGEDVTPGGYMLDVRDKKFKEGSALIPTPRPAGDPTEEMVGLAIGWFKRIGDPTKISTTPETDEIPI
jgi:hypothetical protein